MTPRKIVLEACIETVDEAKQACARGVHQLEVCSRLDLDGLTPSVDLVRSLATAVRVPLKIMIRPREGDFFYRQEELEAMILSIQEFKSCKIDGFVTGALVRMVDGTVKVDVNAMIQLCKAAFPFPVTMHKAIDSCTDIVREVAQLKEISNVHSILTSGGRPTALQGISVLRNMQKAAGTAVQIIAAGRITPSNLAEIQSATGLLYFHGRRIV